MKLIKTGRLTVRMLSDDEMEKRIEREADPHFKAAEEQMLAGCRADPQRRAWHALWVIAEKNGGEVGTLAFMGPPTDGAVEIGYGIDSEHRGQHFGREAVAAAVKWAFEQRDVYFVEAECERENKASVGLLSNLGFMLYGRGQEGDRYYKEKDKSNWATFCMSIGMCMGLAIGMAFGNLRGSTGTGLTLGLSLGVAVGLGIGASLDASEKKKRGRLREKRGYIKTGA